MIDFTKLLDGLKRWCIEILIIIAIIIVGALWINSRREAKAFEARATAAEKHQQAAQDAATRADEATGRANALQTKLDASESQRKAALAKVDRLQAIVDQTPIPPKPGTPPAEQAQLLFDLKAMGTSPQPLQPDRIAFPGTDTPTLWTWGKDAARVPGLEMHLDVQEKLAEGLRSTLNVTTGELSTALAQRDEFKLSSERFATAYSSETQGSTILKTQVGTLTVQRDRAKKTRIYVGIGAFLLGAWADSKLRR